MEYFYTGKYKYARRVPYQNIKLLFTNDLKSRKKRKRKKRYQLLIYCSSAITRDSWQCKSPNIKNKKALLYSIQT